MKTLVKTFACAAAVSVAFFACEDIAINNPEPNGSLSSSGNSSSGSSSLYYTYRIENCNYVTEMPIMDSRVVSYIWKGFSSAGRFITGKDSLKSLFPHIFENEDAKCSYFAISFPGSSYSYHLLSKDMVLYGILNGFDSSSYGCDETLDIKTRTMLVCDDTEEGNLKDKINFNYDYFNCYVDPDWDCATESVHERGVFF
jgi:hypothetical protein